MIGIETCSKRQRQRQRQRTTAQHRRVPVLAFLLPVRSLTVTQTDRLYSKFSQQTTILSCCAYPEVLTQASKASPMRPSA
jgi:hypothetical protein